MKREKAESMLEEARIGLNDIQSKRQAWAESMAVLFDNESASKGEIYAQLKKSTPIGKVLLKLKKTIEKAGFFYQRTDTDRYNTVLELFNQAKEEYDTLKEDVDKYSEKLVRAAFVRLDKLSKMEPASMPKSSLLEPIRQGRGVEISKSAQRVFICWDRKLISPKDELIADILSRDIGIDCVVSYYDIYFQKIPDDETIRNELLDTQLVVLLVTSSFLKQNKKAESPEYRIAKELNAQGKLPILPIVANAGLFSALTINEKTIHGVSMGDNEYRKKLGEQLGNFIVGAEIAKEISSKAFNGRLFLSYRKKDIDHARTFIKTFHSLPGFECIAVWYDNYLTGGRIYDTEIRDAIDAADVFILLVTPNLFEKNEKGETNFVLAEELPHAVKAGKKIVAVEAVPVDKEVFESICPNYEAYLTFDTLQNLLIILSEDSATSIYSDEQAYFLGLAYRWSFFVEHDIERAITMFMYARESVSIWGIKAALEEINIWKALNIDISYSKELKLYDYLISAQTEVLGIDHPDISVSYNNLGTLYHSRNNYDNALICYETALKRNEKLLGYDHPFIAFNCDNIGGVYSAIGNYDDALSYFQRALDIWAKESKNNLNVAKAYNNIALVYKRKGDYKKALTLYKDAYAIKKKILGAEDPDTLTTLANIAVLYSSYGKEGKALDIYNKILNIEIKIYGNESPACAKTCVKIASIVYYLGDYSQALKWLDMARQTQEELNMFRHTDLMETYSLMAVAYARQGMHNDAEKMNEAALKAYNNYLNGEETLDLVWYYGNSAVVSFCRGDFEEEMKCYEKVLEIRINLLGENHPQTLEAHRMIAETKVREIK